MHQVVYLTRNGLLEPLGQSQVMPYLRGLSEDHEVTLVTFEKPEDVADRAAAARAREDCAAHGINWRPRRFHQRPRLITSAWGLFQMGVEALRAARAGRAELIHARSYLPAAVAWSVWRVSGTPFIFDMRAMWPEELITAGRLRRGSLMHRSLERLERICLRDAAGIVSLTEAAVEYLREKYPWELASKHITVIPTCADLDRFSLSKTPAEAHLYGCIGTVLSGWFKMDWLAAFFRAVARHDSKARFELVTRDDADAVQLQIDPEGTLQTLSIFPAKPEQVHRDVRRQTASAMFFTEGTSKLGSMPTRLGEVLGCGIPVVVNAGVGDVSSITRRYRIGVIARDPSDDAMDEVVRDLAELRKDPNLSARCRQAAEEVFSLAKGTEAYRTLYAEILGESDAPASSDAKDAG